MPDQVTHEDVDYVFIQRQHISVTACTDHQYSIGY
jgi:hypothetical protein